MQNKKEIQKKLRQIKSPTVISIVGDLVRIWIEHESNKGMTVTDEDVAHRMMWVMSLLQGRYIQKLSKVDSKSKVSSSRQIDLKNSIAEIKAEQQITKCMSDRDGDCYHAQCPQLKDNEPKTTGRNCPLLTEKDNNPYE